MNFFELEQKRIAFLFKNGLSVPLNKNEFIFVFVFVTIRKGKPRKTKTKSFLFLFLTNDKERPQYQKGHFER